MMTMDGNNSLKRLNIKGQRQYNSYSRSNYRLDETLVDQCHGQTRAEQKAPAASTRGGRVGTKKIPLVRVNMISFNCKAVYQLIIYR